MSDADGRLACIDLVHAYNNHIDTGHADRVPELFTDEGVLDLGRGPMPLDTIRAAMQARATNTERRTTHVTSNLQFTDIGEQTAATTSVLQLYVLDDDGPGAPRAIFRCHDDFIRAEEGEWRFSRRSLALVAGSI